MSYQNINQYVFRRLYLKPLREVTDLSLASDEKDYDQEVIFSPLLIGELDGNLMPLKFDFNSTGTTDCVNCGNFDKDTIVSENYWNPLDLDLINCGKITPICDVGLTGMDNGLVKRFSGETIELNTGLYTSNADKFSRYKYDRRFKMHPVTGFTTTSNRILNDNSYTYDVSFQNDTNVIGNYIKFNGGFYQGFYKSFGYDYQVLPERYNLGWTSEFMLRYRWTGATSTGLNARYPDNKGTFFYYGARAENKFYHYADGSPLSDTGYTRVTQGLNCLETCGCSSTGNTASTCNYVYQQSGVTSQNCSCGQCPCNCETYASIPEKKPKWDEVSNAMSLRLSGDTGSPRLCVKTYRITGGCETTGTCTTGLTYTTGTSVTEWCSTRGIFDDCSGTTYANTERWVQIDAVFQRNTYLDDCDLLYKGGLGEIVKTVYTASSANNSVSLIQPPITQEVDYDPATVEVVEMNERWLDEKDYRLGTLKFYVNGKLFLVVNGFEEIIPRPLNTLRETQIGVAYNISLGGGTQGLHDNLTVTACSTTLSGMSYQQDPECLPTEVLDQTIYSGLTTEIKLEEYFGGSFYGDMSAFRMYTEPLNAAQIRHNFKLLKEKYALLDPFCLNCDSTIMPELVTPSPTPTNTVTPSITPTISPTQTPTLTPTPTNYRILFNVCSGTTVTESCQCLAYGSIWGEQELFDENTQFFDSPNSFNTTNLSGFYSYNDVVVELDSDGFEIGGFSICPTQTPTNTPTSSVTPTITETSTNTPTLTSSPTITGTLTETPTNTSTNTPTNTPTLTQTPTNTETQTQTPTPTSTVGITPTATETQTPTETPTNTETSTPIPTNTETITPTPTITETPTSTDAPIPSQTSTYTLTPTNTETPTNTQTETPTPSVTETPTNTETPTQTPTETPTSTQTSIENVTPSTTPTNSETPTITPTNSETPTNTPTNSSSQSPTPTLTPTNTQTPSLTPTQTPAPTPLPPVPSDPTLEINYDASTNLNFVGAASSGNTFTQWTDLSAAAHNANPIGGATTRPQWWSNVLNGSGATWFDGTSDGLSVNPFVDLQNASGATFIWVGKTFNTSSTQQLSMGESGSTTNEIFIRLSGGTYQVGSANGVGITTTPVDTNFHTHTLVFDGSLIGNSNRLKFFIDGIQQSLSFISNVGTTIPNTIDGLYLGVDFSETYYFSGFINQFIIYSRALSGNELEGLTIWLQNRWGL